MRFLAIMTCLLASTPWVAHSEPYPVDFIADVDRPPTDRPVSPSPISSSPTPAPGGGITNPSAYLQIRKLLSQCLDENEQLKKQANANEELKKQLEKLKEALRKCIETPDSCKNLIHLTEP